MTADRTKPGPKPIDPAVRVMRQVVMTEQGCWEFMGYRNSQGYGKTSRPDGRGGHTNETTHRIIWRALIGEPPEGLQLDHLCRNTACCNPIHLEPVTCKENLRRSPVHGRLKTHCPQGHPYDAENTWISPKGFRRCRICVAERNHRNYLRRSQSGACVHTPTVLEDTLGIPAVIPVASAITCRVGRVRP